MSTTLYTTETIHGELVKGGEIESTVDGKRVNIDIKTLRNAIPAHCLKPSTITSLGYLARDLVFFSALFTAALALESRVDGIARFVICYGVYPYLAGVVLTGLWVLGHECGHGAFSTSSFVANTVGFVVHSALITPYFAWRSTHGRHHQFANNMSTDLNYVPPSRNEYHKLLPGNTMEIEHLVEDAPLMVLLRIILQQLIGWPWYLLTHITAGRNSSPRRSKGWWDNSHFIPWSSLFRENEFGKILASDVGIGVACYALYLAGQKYGMPTLIWTYVLPWMWVNHWIVMITYLHHTSPSLPKYAPESWTYLRGALATVDRDPGAFLEFMLHHIIDLHVVHHLFPRIPHYHTREATDAIRPLLGNHYHVDKGSYWGGLWEAFLKCQWVEPDAEKTRQAHLHHGSNASGCRTNGMAGTNNVDENGVLWYRGGKLQRPVVVMRSGTR